MKKVISALISAFIFTLFPSIVSAESVTISPSVDTYLNTAGFADSSFDNEQFLWSYYNLNTNQMGYILIKFPLNAIPAGAIINNAKLYLYMYEATGTSPISITATTILSDWNSNVTLVNQPRPGDDVASLNVNSIKEYKIWDVTSIVRRWKEGDTPNYGLLIWKKSPQNLGFSRKFYSQNRGNINTNPKLVVSYTPKAVRVLIPQSTPGPIQIKPIASIVAIPNLNLPQAQNDAGANQQGVTISDISSSDITQTDALLTWKTNINATSWVFFGIATDGDKFDQQVGQNDSQVSHAVNLPSLTPNTKYSYKVMSKGADGKEIFGSINYFTTPSFENPSPTPSPSSSSSSSNPLTKIQDKIENKVVDLQIASSLDASNPATQTPATESSQIQSQELKPSSFSNVVASIGMTKVVGILLVLLGLMSIIGVILIYLLTKKVHHHIKKRIDPAYTKKLKVGKRR